MRKFANKINKALILAQGQNRLSHHTHAQHQDTKPKKYLPQIFPTTAFSKQLHCKPYCQNQSNIISKFKCNQLGGNSGTNISTHNNAERLFQCHQPGIYQTNSHDCCCTAGLQNSSYSCTQRYSDNQNPGQCFQYFLQFFTSSTLQTITHQLHAI